MQGWEQANRDDTKEIRYTHQSHLTSNQNLGRDFINPLQFLEDILVMKKREEEDTPGWPSFSNKAIPANVEWKASEQANSR